MTLPDISGPTDTLVFPSPSRFGGTSCATPNSAGAAAVFWSADTNLNVEGIQWLLSTQAGLFRDWGTAGFDGVYGAGGIRLIDFRANTRWLARNYPGAVDDGTVPFHTVAGAHQRVPNGGRLLILGANFGTFPRRCSWGSSERHSPSSWCQTVALPASEIDRVEAPARSHNATHVMIFRTAALLATVFGVASMLSAAPRTSPNYSIPAEAIDSGGRKNGSPTYQNQGSAGLISGASRNASGTVAVGSGYAPQAAAGGSPLQVLNALSRKVHGATSFDIPLPLTGLAGVECRNAGAGGSYQVLVTFTTPVTVGGTSIMSRDGLATATHSVSGAVVTLNLSAVANAQTLGITLLNVSNGSTTNNITIPMGVSSVIQMATGR
jgi:hypothetical protein